MPALEGIEGFVGCPCWPTGLPPLYRTSSWRSEDGDARERGSVRPIRDPVAALFVVAQTSRNGRSLSCTVTIGRVRAPVSVVDPWVSVGSIRSTVSAIAVQTRRLSCPALEELEGFCSASLMADRVSRSRLSSANDDSVEAMERNRDQAGKIRGAGTQVVGAEVLDVREFELALAHLRVPEMADHPTVAAE